MYEVKKKDGLARIAELETRHGKVKLPAFLPVVDPEKQVTSIKELEKAGIEIIITSAYLYRKRGKNEPIHEFLGWKKAVMTDSGAYQLGLYGDVEVTNKEILEFQERIGTDIGVILDIPEPSERAVRETYIRGLEAKEMDPSFALVAPIQGAPNFELVKKSVELMKKLDFPVYAIGGAVKLFNEYEFYPILKALLYTRLKLPHKPIHLFGAGHPVILPAAVALGADMFDSASYALYARERRIITPFGTRFADELEELPFSCPVCKNKAPEELSEKEIALINLYAIINEVRRIRNEIRRGSFLNYLQQTARRHPKLYSALFRLLKEFYSFLEPFDNITRKKALFAVDEFSKQLVPVKRFRERVLNRFYRFAKRAVLNKPSTEKAHGLITDSVLGIIPWELRFIYPANTERIGGKDEEFLKVFLKKHDLELVEEASGKPISLDLEAKAVLKYFYGIDLNVKGEAGGTGRLRRIYLGNELLATLRNDGSLAITLKLGEILSKLRVYWVMVSREAEEFVKEGRSVFCKFVKDASKEFRAGDDVAIVNEDFELLAVGKALLSREEMLKLSKGMAVKVRKGINT